MAIRVVTLKEHHYGKRRKVGDRYEVPGQSALALAKALGWAKEEPTPTPVPVIPISTAALRSPAVKKTPVKRGSYLTRDMKAAEPADQPESIFQNTQPAEE